MSNPKQTPASARQAWVAPRLTRIGTIADVAGGGQGGPQGSNKT